jgi:AcrR family transcriptional regulator
MATKPTKGEQTRRTILDAAIVRFGREGFRATSVADIARDAGVSGTAAYAYFPSKEQLFLAAIDEDAAGVIGTGLSSLHEGMSLPEWREGFIFTLLDAVDEHPLAKRVLSGLEPEVTERVLDIPALAELRKAVGERIRAEQLSGNVRSDIDPTALGNGLVSIVLAILMSVVQVGPNVAATYAADVSAVIAAALEQH